MVGSNADSRLPLPERGWRPLPSPNLLRSVNRLHLLLVEQSVPQRWLCGRQSGKTKAWKHHIPPVPGVMLYLILIKSPIGPWTTVLFAKEPSEFVCTVLDPAATTETGT